DQVLDPDHLVVGVDSEVVLPAPRAVARVVVRDRRPARAVPHPVVETAEAGQEAERHRHEGDGDDDVAIPDRIPVGRPADQADDRAPDEAEERRHPEDAQPPRPRPSLQPGARGRRRVGGALVAGDGHLDPFPRPRADRRLRTITRTLAAHLYQNTMYLEV